ncbi:MAG: hypothetical protein GY844_29580 [Bradyrhizobium sp.]|uniref:hypothetical protein n=1 Tax=Sphingomonas sp. VL_57B TaxID=3144220 RepID=UPI0031F49744|nr:hypothetical protein [Bradyrhizobium sp.]
MPESRTPVIPVRLDMDCECGGKMRPTGLGSMRSPPQYPHLCTACRRRDDYPVTYPHIEFEDTDQQAVEIEDAVVQAWDLADGPVQMRRLMPHGESGMAAMLGEEGTGLMSEPSPIERATEAVMNEIGDVFLHPDDAKRIARAVLAAIREPSDGMIEASFDWSAWAGEERLRDAGAKTWQAMIDTLLAEGE